MMAPPACSFNTNRDLQKKLLAKQEKRKKADEARAVAQQRVRQEEEETAEEAAAAEQHAASMAQLREQLTLGVDLGELREHDAVLEPLPPPQVGPAGMQARAHAGQPRTACWAVRCTLRPASCHSCCHAGRPAMPMLPPLPLLHHPSRQAPECELDSGHLEAVRGAAAALGLDLATQAAAYGQDESQARARGALPACTPCPAGRCFKPAGVPLPPLPCTLVGGARHPMRSPPCLQLLQELFCSGLRSGFVRSLALQRGAAGAQLVAALLATLARHPDAPTAGAAFLTLMALLGDAAGSSSNNSDAALAAGGGGGGSAAGWAAPSAGGGLMLDPQYGLPALAGGPGPPACRLEALPSDAQLLQALQDNGYRPGGGSARGGKQQQRRGAGGPAAAPGEQQEGLAVRLQALKLVLRTAAAVCRYCRKVRRRRGGGPSPAWALQRCCRASPPTPIKDKLAAQAASAHDGAPQPLHPRSTQARRRQRGR
jgi:hypothetical protein